MPSTATVTPPESKSDRSVCPLSSEEFTILCRFLDISEKDDDAAALRDFVARVGAKRLCLDDLAFLQEEYFEQHETCLSPIIQWKLVSIAEFLLKGGSF